MSGKLLQYREGKEPSSILRALLRRGRSKSWACTSDNREIQQRARRCLNSVGQVPWSDDHSSEDKENLDNQKRTGISRTVSSPSLLKKQARRPRVILEEIECGEKKGDDVHKSTLGQSKQGKKGDDVRKSTLGQSKQGKKCQHGSNSKEAQLDQSRTVTKQKKTPTEHCECTTESEPAFLQHVPSLELITRLVVPWMSSKWHKVGILCGLTAQVLSAIQADNPANSEKCCSLMFESWLQKKPGAGDKPRTWATLLEAVQTCCKGATRESIEAELLLLDKHSEGDVSDEVTKQHESANTTHGTPEADSTVLQQVPTLEQVTRLVVPKIAAVWNKVGVLCGITSDMLDVISENNPANSEKCCTQMFKCWLQKKPGTGDKPRMWNTILEGVLTGHGATARECIEKELQSVATSEKICPCQLHPLHTKLRCFYSKECIRDNPLLASATMQYVPLYLVQPKQWRPVAGRVEDEVAAHLARGGVEQVPLEKVPLKYKDILSVCPATGNSRKRVLIEGVPGIGKSTLAQRMCHDWSIGHFAQEFKLVVQVNLRCLPKGEKLSLEDLVFTSIEDPNVVKEVVHFITTHKGRDALFVFDGFDEMSKQMQKTSIIRSIMDGRIAPLSSFVITSRPISAELLYSCVDRRVEICGFGEEEVKEFIRSYFACSNPSAGEKLLSSLSLNHLIARLCYVPLQLLMICYTASLDGDSLELPPTLHTLFESLILHTVNHNLERAGQVERANSLDHVMQICPSFKKLAELARTGVENDTIIFSDLSFEVDSALHGLFNCFEVRNRNGVITHTWHFLHLALQEFMAALDMHKKTPEEQVTFWEQHLSLKYNKEGDFILAEDRYQTMFLIYCGLSNLSNPGIRKMLMDACVCTRVKPTISRGTALSEICEAIAESGNEQFARSILSPCGSTVEIHGHLLSNMGIAWCLSKHFKPMNGAGIRVLGDSAISIPLPILARFLSQLEEVSTLTKVEMHDLQVDGNKYDLQTIRQFLLKLKQLQCFAFEVKCKDDKQLSGNMDLSDTQDEVKTMDLIATLKDVITQHMESLEELTLAITGDSASDQHRPLIKCLETCKKLKSLKLKHVTLSSQDLVVVVQALHNLIALKLKSIHLSDEEDPTSSVISSSVAQHPSLKELTVEMSRAGARCSDSLVKGAVQGISKRCGVEKLALISHPKVYTQLVFPILAILNGGTLKKLRLGVELNPFQPESPGADPAINLSQLIVAFLLPQLSHCTDLRELKVVMSDRFRMWSSKNVSLLPPAIKDDLAKCTKLQKLTVRGTVQWNVLPPVTAAFLHVMTCIRPLEETTLKWCVFDGIDEAVLMFADFMKESRLRRVEMSYCVGLSPLHIAAICRSVQSLNTLEELIISSVSMMGQKDSKEKTDDVSDPEILQSVEMAVRKNESLKTIRIDCTELSWTNIAIAILKGVITNASLREVELVVPRHFPAILPVVVEEVREAKSMLRLVVRAGYNYFL